MTPVRYPSTFATTIRHELKGPANVMTRLHNRTAQKPIPALRNDFTFRLVLQTIGACCATIPIAFLVTRAVIMHIQQSNARMTALRATAVHPLVNDTSSWQVVEWKEGDDTEVIAVFHVDEDVKEPESCSWVSHTGVGICEDDKSGKRWRKSSISWSVGHLGHLKILFGAAQHVLGVLEWSVADAVVLYCQTDPKECSNKE